MDAFFASVEEATTPSLKGKPIVVGADPNNGHGRGVVSTANYKARAYGIHSALPISVAWRLSEEAKKRGEEPAVFVSPDFELYNKVSSHVLDIIKKYSNTIEQASIDEFYFDMSSANDFKKVVVLCQKIQKEIVEKEGVTCSIGIAPNKLIAKIAAGVKKPNGLFVVKSENVQHFLNPLSIRELPGIGPKTGEFLNKKGIIIVEDLLKFSEQELIEMMGKHGGGIYYKVRGIDENPITEFHQAKSIGEQTTFNQNTLEAEFIFNTLKKLSDGVFKSFEKSDFTSFKTIAITVRFSDFETKTSSKSPDKLLVKNDKKRFTFEAIKLMLPFLDKQSNPKRKLIRLIGVRIEKLK